MAKVSHSPVEPLARGVRYLIALSIYIALSKDALALSILDTETRTPNSSYRNTAISSR